MASLREIKARIANVTSTQQIIKAMDTIASTKLLKIRAQLEGVRPMFDALKQQVELLGQSPGAANHVFYNEREVKNTLYIILTSDRGFAGSYNANIMYEALEHMEDKNEKLFVIGSKGYEFFRRREKHIIREVSGIQDSQVYYGTESIARWFTELYLEGEVDEVYLAFTHFENVLNYRPMIVKVLPLPAASEEDTFERPIALDPNLETVIEETVPLYLHINIFQAFSDSYTSEQASRMVTMSSAGDNASDLIEDLTKEYNRERQAAITQELSEIVGGANIHDG